MDEGLRPRLCLIASSITPPHSFRPSPFYTNTTYPPVIPGLLLPSNSIYSSSIYSLDISLESLYTLPHRTLVIFRRDWRCDTLYRPFSCEESSTLMLSGS